MVEAVVVSQPRSVELLVEVVVETTTMNCWNQTLLAKAGAKATRAKATRAEIAR